MNGFLRKFCKLWTGSGLMVRTREQHLVTVEGVQLLKGEICLDALVFQLFRFAGKAKDTIWRMKPLLNEVRKSCDGCAKAKKKCVGGQPCLCCQRWGIKCVFSQKLRPGPAPRYGKIGERTESIGYPMNCFEGIQHYPEFGRFPYTSLYSCPDISPVNMQQGFSRSEFGSVEMGFLKLFLQNLSFSLPFVNHSILTNGINSICLQNSSSLPSDVASVSLTWCCCGFGALLSFRNDHAVEYLKKARKSIQICFDNANDLIGRAYLAIDMLMRNTNIDGEKDIFLRETYLNFGKAILNSVEQTSIDEATRVICEHIRAWDVVKLASDCRLDLNNSVRESFPSIDDFRGLSLASSIPTYCSRILRTWILLLTLPNSELLCDCNIPLDSESDFFRSHKTALLGDCYFLDVYQQNSLSQVDFISFVILRFSIGLHEVLLGNVTAAKVSFKECAYFVASHPKLIFSDMLWFWISLLCRVLFRYDRQESAEVLLLIGRSLLIHAPSCFVDSQRFCGIPKATYPISTLKASSIFYNPQLPLIRNDTLPSLSYPQNSRPLVGHCVQQIPSPALHVDSFCEKSDASVLSESLAPSARASQPICLKNGGPLPFEGAIEISTGSGENNVVFQRTIPHVSSSAVSSSFLNQTVLNGPGVISTQGSAGSSLFALAEIATRYSDDENSTDSSSNSSTPRTNQEDLVKDTRDDESGSVKSVKRSRDSSKWSGSSIHISQILLDQIVSILEWNRPLPWDNVSLNGNYSRDRQFDGILVIASSADLSI